MHKWIKAHPNDDSLWVYNFKKFGLHAKEVEERIREAARLLGCQDIVPIPGSRKELNQLQQLFGAKINRIRETKTRKLRNERSLPPDYRETYEIYADEIAGPRVLLIDDVISTGQTMAHFTKELQRLGFEVERLTLGISTACRGIRIVTEEQIKQEGGMNK